MSDLFSKKNVFRFLNGECSEEEAQLIQQWLSHPTNKERADAVLAEYWKQYAASNETDDSDFNAIFAAVEQHIGITIVKNKKARVVVLRRIAIAITAAACSFAVFFFVSKSLAVPDNISVKTAYGETKKIKLPDGSVVMLNSNSLLRYTANWKNSADREIYLDGEGFFSIKHLPGNQKFRVITDGKFNVEVLGTEFSVYKRNGDEHVVLNSGKVKVDFKDEATKDLIMKPGELVELKSAATEIVKKAVDTVQYNSWKDGRLVFNETPVSELCRIIKENYGMELVLESEVLKGMKINGILPTNNKEMLFKTLELVLQVKLNINGNYIEMKINK